MHAARSFGQVFADDNEVVVTSCLGGSDFPAYFRRHLSTSESFRSGLERPQKGRGSKVDCDIPNEIVMRRNQPQTLSAPACPMVDSSSPRRRACLRWEDPSICQSPRHNGLLLYLVLVVQCNEIQRGRTHLRGTSGSCDLDDVDQVSLDVRETSQRVSVMHTVTDRSFFLTNVITMQHLLVPVSPACTPHPKTPVAASFFGVA